LIDIKGRYDNIGKSLMQPCASQVLPDNIMKVLAIIAWTTQGTKQLHRSSYYSTQTITQSDPPKAPENEPALHASIHCHLRYQLNPLILLGKNNSQALKHSQSRAL
jgi:hypothetical protein